MSLAGLGDFCKNLDELMKSKAYKESSEAEKLDMGYRIIMCNPRRLRRMLDNDRPQKKTEV